MKSRLLAYGLIMMATSSALSQSNGNSYPFWKFTNINGEVKLKGQYRQKYTTINDFSESQESLYFSGGLRLNTSSYVWHPDFLKIDLGGEFFPESNRDDYLVTPDRAEVRTLKGLNMGATLFNNKPVTLRSWASWNDTYSNRENLTDIRSQTGIWGSSLSLRTRILPLNLSYNSTNWDQHEIQSDRKYKTEQKNFEASTNKSFGNRDWNELRYSHNQYFRKDANYYEINNITDNIRLNNRLFLDKDKHYAFRSLIYTYRRHGSQNFNIFNATENLTLDLPVNFRFITSYNLYDQEQETQRSRQNKVTANLQHKLFASLNSNIIYEYSKLNHSAYNETRSTPGFSFRYAKRIPSGQLNLAYSYSNLRNIMDTEPMVLEIYNEEYYLADGVITTLARPYIDMSSITVRDVTGSIIYQLDFDYILIEQGNYIEIQRVPGGQIPNESSVYIDYISIQTGSYKYNAISNNLSTNINLFNRLLDLYYRGQFMNYKNVEKSELLILNYIKRNTVGGKINLRFVELGTEYEYQNSTITPYKLMRYYLNLQKRFDHLLLSLSGNIRDYNMLDENVNRKYSDISGKAVYEFTRSTTLDLMLGYRHQDGPGIDLNLVTASTEFNTVYRKLYLTVGLDLYRRDYLGDDTNYYGGYIQFVRKF